MASGCLCDWLEDGMEVGWLRREISSYRYSGNGKFTCVLEVHGRIIIKIKNISCLEITESVIKRVEII